MTGLEMLFEALGKKFNQEDIAGGAECPILYEAAERLVDYANERLALLIDIKRLREVIGDDLSSEIRETMPWTPSLYVDDNPGADPLVAMTAEKERWRIRCAWAEGALGNIENMRMNFQGQIKRLESTLDAAADWAMTRGNLHPQKDRSCPADRDFGCPMSRDHDNHQCPWGEDPVDFQIKECWTAVWRQIKRDNSMLMIYSHPTQTPSGH